MINGRDLYDGKIENFIVEEDENKLLSNIKGHEHLYNIKFIQSEKSKVIYVVSILFYVLLLVGLFYYNYVPFNSVWNNIHYLLVYAVITYGMFGVLLNYKYSVFSKYTIKIIKIKE